MASYYCDYGSGDDTTGDGSIGTPWKTIQKALNTMTTAQANQLNLKSGTSFLESGLDFATYGTNLTETPLTISGYQATEDDGGIATIDGSGSVILTNISLNAVLWKHLKFEDWGTSTYCLSLNDQHTFFECEFDGLGTAAQWITFDRYCYVIRCLFHSIDFDGSAIPFEYVDQCHIRQCFFQFDDTITSRATCVEMASYSSLRDSVLVFDSIGSSSNAVSVFDTSCVENNIFINSGTISGNAIKVLSSSESARICNNVVMGFSNAVDVDSSGTVHLLSGNRYYNNTTNLNNNGIIAHQADNSALASNPFNATGSTNWYDDDFIASDLMGIGLFDGLYNPGNIWGTRSRSRPHIGAIAEDESGGGGGVFINTRRNSLIGR